MAERAIIDTDIGSNVDDSWALALALRSPELDVRLVTVVTGDTRLRARLAADLLGAAGREDVPVARGRGGEGRTTVPVGSVLDEGTGRGDAVRIEDDGAAAIVDTVMAGDQPTTIVAIGPLTNLAAALDREPRIARHARVVSMHGALAVGQGAQPAPAAEYNAATDVAATRAVHAAGWEVMVVPLDVTRMVVLPEPRLAAVRAACRAGDGLLCALLAHDRAYRQAVGAGGDATTALHDVVAVHLATGDLSSVHLTEKRLLVGDDGTLRPDRAGHRVTVATRWRDLDAFVEAVTGRLTSPSPASGPA